MAPTFHSREIEARNFALSQLAIWRRWGSDPCRISAYDGMARMLPPSTAKPSFELARALLAEHRLARPAEPEPLDLERVATDEERTAYFAHNDQLRLWTHGTALALRDRLWGWDGATVELRERAFDAVDPADAPGLAAAMARLPEAPWRRWACASPVAERLLDELDLAGQREPAIAKFGASSLAALMGFAGMPFAAWGRAVAEASTPDGFVAESADPWSMHFVQNMLPKHPDAAPRLPCIPGYGEELSRTMDVCRAGESAPQLLLCMEALGFVDRHDRAGPMEPLAAAQASAFAQSCMSAKASGLPLDFDRLWPMAAAMGMARTDSFDPVSAMAARGGSLLDRHCGQPIWEGALEPTSEQGSEGDFAWIDDQLMEQVVASGADLRKTGLARKWARQRRRPDWDKDCSITEFYSMVLDPPRAAQANEVAAKWEAQCERIDIDAAALPGKASPKAKGL